MATSDPNDTDQKALSLNDLVALAGRLVTHADGIENIAAQGMATDMRLAAQAIEHLLHTKEPADLFVNVYENVDAEPVLSNVPLREVIGDDAEEYDDCRRTLLADGRCTTGGGASPLYHLRRVPKGAGFRSLADTWADTTSAHGRLMITILGGLAEFERSLILARTGEGRTRAMARGVRFGRKPKLTAFQVAEAIRRREAGEAMTDIGRSYGVSHSTISRLQPMPSRIRLVAAG
jgi:hypothetical protein